MNILAADYGRQRIGLAWVQQGLGVVLPFGVISEKDDNAKLSKLAKIIKEESIDKLILGLPFSLNGKENLNTERIRNFAEELKSRVDINIDFENELFSSQQADRLGEGVSRDEKAAMAILQSYLERKKI